MSTLIVTGSRDHKDYKLVSEALDRLDKEESISLLVHGDCPYGGADYLAEKWANTMGIKVDPYPADWNAYGKAAGPIRNTQMLDDYPKARVAALPLGQSKGTRGCMTKAQKRGMQVYVYG